MLQHGFRCLYHQEWGQSDSHHLIWSFSECEDLAGEGPIGSAGEGQDFEPQMGKRSLAGSSTPPPFFTHQPFQVRTPRTLADTVCMLKQGIAVGTPEWPLASTPSSSIFSHPGLISSPWEPHTHSFWDQGPACSFSHECD